MSANKLNNNGASTSKNLISSSSNSDLISSFSKKQRFNSKSAQQKYSKSLQKSLANGTIEEHEGLIMPGDMSDELKNLNITIDRTVVDVCQKFNFYSNFFINK